MPAQRQAMRRTSSSLVRPTRGPSPTFSTGRAVEASKTYRVAGWATVGSKSSGPPVWETVAEYLRAEKTVKITKLNTPKLKNVNDNPGMGYE